jgi:hypothetical protein
MSNNLDVNKNFCYTNASSQIYLNSSNADLYLNGTMKSNLTFFFQDVLTFDRHIMTKKFSIVNAQFPVSYYLINDSNNKIIINIQSDAGIVYTFPNGNYNVTQFINQWYITVGTAWKLTYSSITNKITFSYPYSFKFSFNDINSLMLILGFNNSNLVYSSMNGKITSPYAVNFGGILKLDVKTSSFNLSNMDSYQKGRVNTIASIPVNSAQNGYILYNNFTNYNSMFKASQISDLNIIIQDEFNNFIDFNNCDWSITIQIDVMTRILESKDTLEDIYQSYAENYLQK